MTAETSFHCAALSHYAREEHAIMKKNLTGKEYVYVASMLFGMFFGAGNLIFPVHMGQLAGQNIIQAVIGFLITGVGLPLMGVAALGISKCSGLYELSMRVNRPYAVFFTCLLYLTIGPFFCIPRCATVSFTVGLENVLPAGHAKLYLMLFSAAFFAAVLFFSLNPGKILVYVGKVLNPVFLLFLAVLVIVALLSPAASAFSIVPSGDYAVHPFFTGILEGYNTMDVLASLAFGIVVIQVIRGLGVDSAEDISVCTVRAGIFSCLLMAFIYLAVTVVGAQSRGIFETSNNGGIALAQIAQHYLGGFGLIILAATVTLACLKTAVGLTTSCAETFTQLFPKSTGYRGWAIIFSSVSFLIANVGLNAIIEFAVPVLMFLCPLAVVLIALTLTGRLFGNDRRVYRWAIGFTLPASVCALFAALPDGAIVALHLEKFNLAVHTFLPLASLGLGWVCPAAAGFAVGLIAHFVHCRRKTA